MEETKVILTDEQMHDIIYALDNYAVSIDSIYYGLPVESEYVDDMKQVIIDTLNRQN